MTRGGDEAAGPDEPPLERAGGSRRDATSPAEGHDEAARADESPPAPLALRKADLPASEVLEKAKDVTPVPEKERVEVEKGKVDLSLQKIVGYGALGLMGIQVVVADFVFIFYAHKLGWAALPTGQSRRGWRLRSWKSSVWSS